MKTITEKDVSLVKQTIQRRYIKLAVLNRERRSIGSVTGRLISGNIRITGGADIRRSAGLTMQLCGGETDESIRGILPVSPEDAAVNYYIRLYCGIEDNSTTQVSWYCMGIFCAQGSQFRLDADSRILSVTLCDLMCELNGERSGTLRSYGTVVKNSQRIDDVIKNVLSYCGFEDYDICPVGVLRDKEGYIDDEACAEDLLVPYDMEFPAGTSAYEIIRECVGLYPYYEAGFDADGVFFVRRRQEPEGTILDADTMRGLVISESTDIQWDKVKNIVEVWGRDGLYYGEARDENPESPFQVASCKPLTLTVTDNEYGVNTDNIRDIYKDTELAAELEEEQAECEETIARLEMKSKLSNDERQELYEAKQTLGSVRARQQENTDVSGNELARQWAEKLLYEKARLNDTITLTTVLLPFVNDTGFKISYRSKTDNIIKNYIVTDVNHEVEAGKTVIRAARSY